MANNLQRFKKDLERLTAASVALQMAFKLEISDDPTQLRAELVRGASDSQQEKLADFLKNLPSFSEGYERWYSECLAVLRQLLPDRLQSFISHYEEPKGRKTLDASNYVLADYLRGVVLSRAGTVLAGSGSAASRLSQQISILKAARARFESSLFEMRALLQAELFDTEIDAARELLKKGFLRAAGAVAGVVLEKHLLQVCRDHNIEIKKKNPGIGDLNELLKSNAVIDVLDGRKISMLGDIRNICDHHKQSEPTSDQVNRLGHAELCAQLRRAGADTRAHADQPHLKRPSTRVRAPRHRAHLKPNGARIVLEFYDGSGFVGGIGVWRFAASSRRSSKRTSLVRPFSE